MHGYEQRTTNYNLRKQPIQPRLSTICDLIMQNEPNFRKSQMNVSKVLTRHYKNKCDWTLGENEPKTNPIYRGVASGEAGSNPIRPPKPRQFSLTLDLCRHFSNNDLRNNRNRQNRTKEIWRM